MESPKSPRNTPKIPARFRCSPVPRTAELVEAIFTRPQTCPTRSKLGVRPLSTACIREILFYPDYNRAQTSGPTPAARPMSDCSQIPGPNTSARPLTAWGQTPGHNTTARPLTAWGQTPGLESPNRPRTAFSSDGNEGKSFRMSCAFVRKRIREIREARIRKEARSREENYKTGKHISDFKPTTQRRASFFAKRDSKKVKVDCDVIPEEDMSEEERREREDKRRHRHARMTKLIWWFRVLRAICGLAQDMKKLSMAVTENTTVSQMYVYNACGYPGLQDGDQSLFFDKSQFSRRKTMMFPVWAQKLAILSTDARTEEDVRQIRGMMLMMKSFREKYTEFMQYKMAKVAMYINCEKGRVILRQGHWGLNFYFIYSGSVFVQKEITDPKTKGKKIQTQNIIRAGESFGEIAILGDGKRTASIICREPTEVFQVDKDTFLETCPEIFEAELDIKMTFVEQFELFHNWDEEHLRRLCFLSQAIYIPHGRIIETDWSKTSYVYFVMQGRISLMRQFDITGLSSAETVRVSGMMDKPLFLPDPTGDRYGGEQSLRYANVGELRLGCHSDLRVLLNDDSVCLDTLSMVSQGARVFRVEHRLIKWLGPMASIEEYLRKRYVPYWIPADVELCQRYVEESNWDVFKQKTVTQVPCARQKKEMAMIPVTQKGSSGWARWPGSGTCGTTGTTFHSPTQPREQVAEFLVGTQSGVKPTNSSRFHVRRDTVGVPLDARRTSLFPRSRIQKQILRTFPDDPVSNENRRLIIVPSRPKLNYGKPRITIK